MKLAFVLFVCVAVAGCMKRNLTAPELSKLIPGLESKDAVNANYAFRGNSGGYMLAAKLPLSSNAIDRLLVDTQEDEVTLAFATDRFEGHFKTADGTKWPDWFDFKPTENIIIRRKEGANPWTSNFIYSYYVDRERGIVWVQGGGI